jgi:hypothetical protein
MSCRGTVSIAVAGGDGQRRLDGFRILTEYECGRAQIAIEWVARAQKPIVEIGGIPIAHCDLKALALDLDRCIELSGESVRAFIAPSGGRFCCYGFYKFPWAIDALLFAWGIKRVPRGTRRSLWLQGLVFGYSPSAIQDFINAESASSERESKLRSRRRTGIDRQYRVGIYGLAGSPARRRNMRTDRYQTPG